MLLIADHGSMYEKGRLHYVYHPNDEAIRVIGAVFEPQGKPRIDGRFFSTPDLSASILDYFALEFAAVDGAESLFADGPGRPWVRKPRLAQQHPQRMVAGAGRQADEVLR